MSNRGKVIKGLEFHKSGLCDNKEGKICPYWLHNKCLEELCTDALALLKEQEPMKPKVKHFELHYASYDEYENRAYCPKCGIQFIRQVNYCPECGQAVKWNKI